MQKVKKERVWATVKKEWDWATVKKNNKKVKMSVREKGTKEYWVLLSKERVVKKKGDRLRESRWGGQERGEKKKKKKESARR